MDPALFTDEVSFKINGAPVTMRIQLTKTLLSVIREDLGLIGAKEGCGQGDCGSCVILVDDHPMNSCLMLAAEAAGTRIITLEGVAGNDGLKPLQREFCDRWGFQCGYCTPGMIMSCHALLQATQEPTRDQVREAIEGNLCRCTNYRAIIDSVTAAAGSGHDERHRAP